MRGQQHVAFYRTQILINAMQTPRDKIRELRALLDEGLLSEQEFSQRKNAILDSEFAPGTPDPHSTLFGDLPSSTDLGFLAGQEVGGFSKRYRLERLLGQGGMGQVWLAVDLATQAELGHSEMVALKILPPHLTQSTVHARLLIEEASVVRKLAHENIVRVYEWAQDPATSSYFIIMEYLDGQDLETYLATHGPCSLKHLLTLLMPVAHALQYAWDKHRLVHRDLKPSNLLLTRRGDIKLLDFGISARLRSHTNPGTDLNPSSKPTTKMPGAGTAGYRAPEAGTQQNLFSPSLDVYAVAVMMLEMLTGARLFMAHHPHSAQQNLLATTCPATLNTAQWQILRSGFATDPQQRPASVLALLQGMLNAGTFNQAIHTNAVTMQIKMSPEQSAAVQNEAAAMLRAEQRRQRKELEQQRRQQASASLQALIAKQRKIRESEQQDRITRSDNHRPQKIRIDYINAEHDRGKRLERTAQQAAQQAAQHTRYDGADMFTAPIGNSLNIKDNSRPADSEFLGTGTSKKALPQAQTKTEVDTGMSWEHAKQYLAWIGQQTGQQVHLPSEAEWENLRRTVSSKLAN